MEILKLNKYDINIITPLQLNIFCNPSIKIKYHLLYLNRGDILNEN